MGFSRLGTPVVKDIGRLAFSAVIGGTQMSFATDIKPLFREQDRESMDFAFDLWSFEDVTMPCDEPWQDEKIQKLRDWIAAGTPP